MAKFLKVHHKNNDDEFDILTGKKVDGIEEYIVNLEMIIDVDEENHEINMADGETVHVARGNEWEKIMAFVKSNEM